MTSASQERVRKVTQEKVLHAAVFQSTAADKLYFYPCNLSMCLLMPKPPETMQQLFINTAT